MRLEGKVAIVTGSTSGIGEAIARRFAAAGAKVVIAARKENIAQQIIREIRASGGEAIFSHLEVSEPDQWANTLKLTRETYGALHILVNNAGSNAKCGMPDVDLEEWDRIMAINVTGPMVGIQTCAPLIRDSGGGSIVNISSLGGLLAGPSTAYCTTKWAMCGLSRSAAFTFASWGIRSNAICPGFIAGTNMTKAILAHDTKDTIGDHALLGRYGTTEELASVAEFLASDDSSYVTGLEIPVDGGLYSAGIYGMNANAALNMFKKKQS